MGLPLLGKLWFATARLGCSSAPWGQSWLGVSALVFGLGCQTPPDDVQGPDVSSTAQRSPHAIPTASIRVAAAADLSAAFEELARDFSKETSIEVQLAFGASGILSKQIQEGAPFDVFASASMHFIDATIQRGACDPASRAEHARGRLALWVPPSRGPAPKTLAELLDPKFRRIAIAHPEHAPYGRAAEHALANAKLMRSLQARIVIGENVRQAYQFAQTGNADIAIVALSLVVGDLDKNATLVDPSLYPPIQQGIVACLRGENSEAGHHFVRYAIGPKGKTLLERYGFGPPASVPR